MEPMFDHDRLEVYSVSRQFNREVRDLLPQIPRGQAESRDNLRRAAMSVSRNIAEGSGRWKARDKVHFYHIARASATECASSLDELIDYNLVLEQHTIRARQTVARVVAMLTAMIKSVESREDRA
jgi:four helix bundle protein